MNEIKIPLLIALFIYLTSKPLLSGSSVSSSQRFFLHAIGFTNPARAWNKTRRQYSLRGNRNRNSPSFRSPSGFLNCFLSDGQAIPVRKSGINCDDPFFWICKVSLKNEFAIAPHGAIGNVYFRSILNGQQSFVGFSYKRPNSWSLSRARTYRRWFW